MNAGKAEFRTLLISDIQLDLKNPRIARVMEMYGESVTAEQISLALESGAGRSGSESGSNTTYISLRDSIKANGGIIHPIIVNKNSEGKYIVIEGNTRVQIYREFFVNNVQGTWDTIPAMVYDNLGQAYVDAIRLQAHLVGPREWDPYSKAKYLHFLSTQEHLTLNQIVDFCGGNKTEVNNYINAYIDMEKYYRPLLESDADFDHRKFSAFVELQKNNIKSSLMNHGFVKSDFAQWIIDEKIGRLENVRSLPRVLNNPRSKEIFIHQNMEEALKVLITTPTGSTLSDATIEQLAYELCKKAATVTWQYVQKLRNDQSSETRDLFFTARDTLSSFCKDIETEE